MLPAVGERPATITTLVGFELVASPLLLADSSLGSVRKALLDSSVLWLVVPAGLGAWRTRNMDG